MAIVRISTTNIIKISLGVTVKISPIRYEEYFENPPFLDNITIPIAIESDEKTLIIVSVDAVFVDLTFVIIRLKNMPKTSIDIKGFLSPKSTPKAIPVNALCPNASEKNAILLFTAIVPRNAKSGETIIVHKSAFFIKS